MDTKKQPCTREDLDERRSHHRQTLLEAVRCDTDLSPVSWLSADSSSSFLDDETIQVTAGASCRDPTESVAFMMGLDKASSSYNPATRMGGTESSSEKQEVPKPSVQKKARVRTGKRVRVRKGTQA